MSSKQADKKIGYVPFIVRYAGFAAGFPLLAAHLSNHYDVLMDIPIPEIQGVRVLVERDRPVARLDGSTGWPCFQS